jgi:Fe2+ transport system protein FeoA
LTLKLKIIIITFCMKENDTATRTLADLLPTQQGRIRFISGTDGLSQRLSEIGFTPGQMIRVVRFAPLGDPMQVRIRGFDIALRRKDAQRIVLDLS